MGGGRFLEQTELAARRIGDESGSGHVYTREQPAAVSPG